MSSSLLEPVVVDNGSGWLKAGFAGEDVPRAVVPNIIGRYRHPRLATELGKSSLDFYVGNDAMSRRGILSLNHPIQHGIITNWDDLEKVWTRTFYKELRIAPEERTFLLTETSLGPSNIREKMSQVMFETFGTPALSIALQSTLALRASGLSTGLVVDSGDGVTHVVPIFEGHALSQGIIRLDIGGRSLTDYMRKLSAERGYSYPVTGGIDEFETVRDIKEKLCYVALDFDQEMQIAGASPTLEKSHETPDGQILSFGEERFRCPEALFRPELLGMDAQGIHQLVLASSKKCGDDILADLLGNIVLAGGSTMFPGFAQRLKKELKLIVPDSITSIEIRNMVPERNLAAWIGGSQLASDPELFAQVCVSKEDYNETGPSIIHRIGI